MKDDKKGRKPCAKPLKRIIDTAPMPLPLIQRISQNAAFNPSISENKPQQQKLCENNEDFYLLLAPPNAKICGHCNMDILRRPPIDSVVIKHNERYVYPIKLSENRLKWLETAVSKKKTLPVYYHARSQCIYSRFRQQYFDCMPLHVSKEAAPYLSQLVGFTHPSIA